MAPPNNRSTSFVRVSLVLTLIIEFSVGSSILFFPGLNTPPQTHHQSFEPLANRLAVEGHDVTIFSCSSLPPTVERDESIQYFCPKKLQNWRPHRDNNSNWEELVQVCQEIYDSPDFIEWAVGVSSSLSFDVVMINSFWRECGLPLAHFFGAKHILFTPSTFFYGDHDVFGLPTESSFAVGSGTTENSWIPQPLLYEYHSLLWYFWRGWRFQPRFDEIVQNYLVLLMARKDGRGQEQVADSLVSFPPIAELERRTALFFVGQDFVSADFSRCLPPFVVPVGGMHCSMGKEISDKAILEAIEKSEGFMVINFENFFTPSDDLASSFSKFLKILETSAADTNFFFIWRQEEVPVEFVPKNIFIITKPMEMGDLLGHPKCRGLISNGGMLNYQSGIYHGVPQLILSGDGDGDGDGLFMDQQQNAKMVEVLGIGINLKMFNLTGPNFQKTVRDLLENERYSKEVKDLSILFKDRPLSPLDTAVYWTNFVLRHDDRQMAHLKSPAMTQYWWQRRLLHIWGLMLLLLILAVGVRLLVFYFAMKLFRRARHYFATRSSKIGDKAKLQ